VASQEDVRRIAMSLPATTEGTDGFAFLVGGKAFVWAWQERIDPKRALVPSRDVIAVRVGNEFEKETLIDLDPDVSFTEAHYNGYPAILVRLAAIDLDLLKVVLTEGWQCRASRRLLADHPDGRADSAPSPTDALPGTLAKPALQGLAEAGFTQIGQLDAVRVADLRKLHGVGPTAIAELRRVLAAGGLSLRE
jgi:hypothetical protein